MARVGIATSPGFDDWRGIRKRRQSPIDPKWKFEHAIFPSRLEICNEHGHAKILQKATMAFKENGTSLIELGALAKKELQYWQQLKVWRCQNGLHASMVIIFHQRLSIMISLASCRISRSKIGALRS